MPVHYTYVLLSQEDNRDEAFRRERFLETGKGKRFSKSRHSGYLESISWNRLERH